MTDEERNARLYRLMLNLTLEEQEKIIKQQRIVREHAEKKKEREKEREQKEAIERALDARLKAQPYVDELPLDGISPVGVKVIMEDRERRRKERT
jgi:hypothetical protein